MRLDIDDNSLHDLLQSKKEYIGGSWINGIVNVIGGISLAVTIYSAKIPLLLLSILLYLLAAFLFLFGGYSFFKNIGKRSYNFEKLYNDIKQLSISDNQYSLVAILNDFEGDSANKVLLKYFPEGWETYMFLSYRSAPEDDENNVISRVARSLKIKRIHIKVKFLTEIQDQPKYSPDHKLVRSYHNKYYQVFISEFPDLLKQEEFTLDGAKYKWMTLDGMWADKQIKANNSDVLCEFEKYIFNTKKRFTQSTDKKISVSKNIYIRLNRVCNLSCSFCLTAKKSQGLSTEQIKNVLEILQLNGVKKIKLTGGEPTLHTGFLEIVKHSVELGLNTVIYSNLCASDSIIEQLINYPISVSTSIHGDEEFHDSITHKKGTYKKIYKNILKLISANIPVSIHMVVMDKNFGLAETVIKDAIEAKVKKVTFQTLIPREGGAELFNHGENIRDIREKLKLLYPLRAKYESKIEISFSDLYEKNCCVLETDGAIYLEKWDSGQDKFIRGLI